MSVLIDIQENGLETSQGMLGEYGTNKMLARDGVSIIEDPIAFGQEWQVLPTDPQLFQVNRSPEYPEKCILPDPAAKESRRRLGETVALKSAKAACAHWGDQKQAALCIADVMATGDLDYAKVGPYF